MIRSLPRTAAMAAIVLAASACSSNSEPESAPNEPVTKFSLPHHDQAELDVERKITEAMPGKIDPPDATWRETKSGAIYGEPDRKPLIEMACNDGMVDVTRNVASDDGAKALFAFVGYRGILRLKVENDGAAWHGSLRSDDPLWIAVTGGPFYATVAGGGKVISPASSIASSVITGCKPEADATIKGAAVDTDETA